MDNILQRMLRVEEEARELVREAEAEAARIREEGRRESTALEEEMQAETAKQAEALVEERVAEAEAAKRESLDASEKEFDKQAAALREQVSRKRQFLVETLAYPFGPPAGGSGAT